MTIEQANSYFEALPDGFASTDQLRAALPASAQKVQFVGVAGTAGKTTVAALLAATLRAAGIHAGLYHAGCEPLSVRVRVDGAPVDEGLLCLAAEAQAAAEPLPQDAAELAAAAYAFGEAGCTLAVVELPDAGLAEALPQMPVCAVTAVGPDGVARLAERYAGQHGVEPRLVMAIIKVESGFDAKAVSSAGASGLMQLMPGTQRHLGVRDAFNPDENVEGGVRYFRSMLDRYGGNVSLALAAYNAGPANVDKYGGIPPFEETRNYVRKVLALYATP